MKAEITATPSTGSRAPSSRDGEDVAVHPRFQTAYQGRGPSRERGHRHNGHSHAGPRQLGGGPRAAGPQDDCQIGLPGSDELVDPHTHAVLRVVVQRPRVAVGVGELGEARIVAALRVDAGLEAALPRVERRLVPDLPDVDAATGQLGPRRFKIGATRYRPLTEPGSASVRPTPICTEHAEPGGVSCTTRKSGLGP